MCKVLSHTAVNMNTENMKVGTAVGSSDRAGIAVSAVEIWVYNDTVSDFESLRVVLLVDLFNNTCQLMADDSGVGDESVRSSERADVAAADTCCHNLDKCLAFATDRLILFYARYIPWFLIFDSFHYCSPFTFQTSFPATPYRVFAIIRKICIRMIRKSTAHLPGT